MLATQIYLATTSCSEQLREVGFFKLLPLGQYGGKHIKGLATIKPTKIYDLSCTSARDPKQILENFFFLLQMFLHWKNAKRLYEELTWCNTMKNVDFQYMLAS